MPNILQDIIKFLVVLALIAGVTLPMFKKSEEPYTSFSTNFDKTVGVISKEEVTGAYVKDCLLTSGLTVVVQDTAGTVKTVTAATVDTQKNYDIVTSTRNDRGILSSITFKEKNYTK